MKNKIIKTLLIFIISIIFLGINKTVQANSINKISMDIYIDNKGDAQVTETWTCNTNQGTEVYHPYYNLGKSEITNLSVEEAEKKYTTLNTWDTSGSLASKANKCGINKISNGVEICWGISSYGSHTYKVKYNISKFVSELTDAQMIYWTLIPYDFSNSIGDVKIKIYSDKYIQDTIDVWGYGNYGGLAYVKNGAIYMDSDGRLDKDEYMTILVKFPLETFNTQNKLSKQFENYLAMAQEGSTKYNNKKENPFIIIFSLMMTFLPTIFIFLIIIFTSKSSQNGIGYAKERKRIPKDIQYFRDIPCQGNIFEAYYIGYTYGIIKKKTDLLGALMLKWIKEEKVKTKKIKINKTFGKEKEETALELIKNNPNFEDEREQKLYSMLNEASGDGILEKKELEKWCRGKYNKILTWFSNAIEKEKTKLVDKGLIIKKEKTTMKIFKTTTYKVTYELTNKAIELAGLKKFLLDYTLIKEKTALEVVLMENYLIYAQLMGIAKQVAKEFKDLYPELIEQTHYTSYEDIIWIHYCSSSGISSANSARQAAESYSSGGGGFSSGGGGGGSFGGGGGGRRLPLNYCMQNKKIIGEKTMKFIIQRVSKAQVKVQNKTVGKIEKGFMVLIGITHQDTKQTADYLVNKLINLRVFQDKNDKMNLSLKDIKGSLLLVSQFTLYANCQRGNRPSFTEAAKPEVANKSYEYIITKCKQEIPDVQTGIFGANMQIDLTNDGPVTIILEK